ncbi:MAG: ABC transporter permease [Burkholderiales bacterium]|nr:ABC transporter permease [Anaerolineae bacterium]
MSADSPAKTQRIPSALIPILVVLILTIMALLIGAVAVVIAGKSPLLAIEELIRGAVGTRNNIAATLTRSIPIVICGLAATTSFKAGLFNLGLEGQMVVGALASAVTANALQGLPAIVLLPVTILAGCAAGALMALPAAWWQTRFNVPLIISTLLLNYIAVLFVSYLVNNPLRDLSGGAAVPQTVMIPEAIRFGVILSGTRLHAGILALLILPPLLAWIFRRTRLGYQLRMTGLNPDFAAYGGISVQRMTLLAMAASGALAGLAGAVQVLGVDFRFIDNSLTAGGYAWTGFIAAILAQANPALVVLTGLFLAGIEVGAAGMQRNTQIPLQIADIVQAGIIFMIAVRQRVGQWLRHILLSEQRA